MGQSLSRAVLTSHRGHDVAGNGMPSASLPTVQNVGMGELTRPDIPIQALQQVAVSYDGMGRIPISCGHGLLPSANNTSIV
jgi:hypothetical protein